MIDFNSLEYFTEKNHEPTKPLDTRRSRNGGVLSFYVGALENSNEVMLDIANYYFKSIRQEICTIKPEEYNSNDKDVAVRRENLLNLCSKHNVSFLFGNTSKLDDLLKFAVEKCDANYQTGRYCYIKEMINTISFIIKNIYALIVETPSEEEHKERFESFNKLYEYSKFINMVYANYNYDMLETKIIMCDKSKIKTKEQIIDFMRNELVGYEKVFYQKNQRYFVFNQQDLSFFDKRMNDMKDIFLINMLKNLSYLKMKNPINTNDFMKDYCKLFSVNNLVEVEFIKNHKHHSEIEEISYLNIGYTRTSVQINTFLNMINLDINIGSRVEMGESTRHMTIDTLVLSKTSGDDIYFDLVNHEGVSAFVFKIKEEIAKCLPNDMLNKLKVDLLEKITEVYQRGGSEEENNNIDLLFMNNIRHMLSLYQKMDLSDSVEKKEIKRRKI